MEHEHEAELVPVIREDREDIPVVPMISDEQVVAAEKAVANMVKVKNLSLRATNKNDWQDMGGKPYLCESGCSKVAAVFGVSFTDSAVREIKTKIDGERVIRYEATVTARFSGRTLEERGIASTDDDFFGWRKVNGVRTRLPLSEVDINSVQKKALTNAMARALKKILGLGNLTWEDVQGAGVDRNSVGAVSYKSAKPKPPGTASAGQDTSVNVRLRAAVQDLADLTSRSAEEVLAEASSFKGSDGSTKSARSVDNMSAGWAGSTLKKVEKALADLTGGPREPGTEG